MLDVLIVLNLLFTFAISVLLLTNGKMSNFSIIPAVIRFSMIFNLLVLIAGIVKIIKAGNLFNSRFILYFSSLMTNTNDYVGFIIGAVIFVMFSVFLMVVIIKSAVKIMRVTALFMLNGMPEKHMAIDAGFSDGTISEKEAEIRKIDLQYESDCYRAMDSLARLISGCIRAEFIIVVTGFIVGLLLDVKFHNKTFLTVAGIYIPLFIAVGFTAQLPILLESIAAWIIFHRAVSIPAVKSRQKRISPLIEQPIYSSDPMMLELGYNLIPLVEKERGAELLELIQDMRWKIALDLGIIIPRIRIIDNMLLGSSAYCFKIDDVNMGTFTIRLGCCLCFNTGTVKKELEGEKTKDPASDLPALWISENKRDEAEQAGYTVVDPPAIIATHLVEIIKSHAAEIFKVHEAKIIIDGMEKEHPELVEEVFKQFTIEQIHIILQNLLKEQISIRNMVKILKILAENGSGITDTRVITEKVKEALCTAQ